MPAETVIDARTSLTELLSLSRLADDRFVSAATYADDRGIYGGLLAGQGLRAATDTVPGDLHAHSLNLYFLRAGDPLLPIEYRVTRDRDGRSFSSRRVEAWQGERLLATITASFQRPADGIEQQPAAPPGSVPAVDTEPVCPLPTRGTGLEFRDAQRDGVGLRPSRVWGRVVDPVQPDDAAMQNCVLAYFSDMFNGLRALPSTTAEIVMVTLNHSLWFHRPVTVSEWMLVDLVPQTSGDGRGVYLGRIFSPGGLLLASLAQECTYRRRG